MDVRHWLLQDLVRGNRLQVAQDICDLFTESLSREVMVWHSKHKNGVRDMVGISWVCDGRLLPDGLRRIQRGGAGHDLGGKG